MLQRVERDPDVAAVTEAKRQNLMRKELAWLRRGAPARPRPKFRVDAANQLIEDVPPIRNGVELAKLATSRLGKDVVDLLDVSVSFPTMDGGDRSVLRDVEWRIGPGERTGIVGANGAGRSTHCCRADRRDAGTGQRTGQDRQDGQAGSARSAVQSLGQIAGDPPVRDVLEQKLKDRLSGRRNERFCLFF